MLIQWNIERFERIFICKNDKFYITYSKIIDAVQILICVDKPLFTYQIFSCIMHTRNTTAYLLEFTPCAINVIECCSELNFVTSEKPLSSNSSSSKNHDQYVLNERSEFESFTRTSDFSKGSHLGHILFQFKQLCY